MARMSAHRSRTDSETIASPSRSGEWNRDGLQPRTKKLLYHADVSIDGERPYDAKQRSRSLADAVSVLLCVSLPPNGKWIFAAFSCEFFDRSTLDES